MILEELGWLYPIATDVELVENTKLLAEDANWSKGISRGNGDAAEGGQIV